jgi:glycerol uptake facilitator-like aquaporin
MYNNECGAGYFPCLFYRTMIYAYLAEFFAALFLTYVVLATGNPLAIGATYAFILLLTYRVTSASVNPIVTITMAAAGKIAPSEVIPICIMQILGGLIALEIYKRFVI